MPQVIATRLDTILLQIQAQLIAVVGWPAERVLIVPPDKISTHPEGDGYLWLYPSRQAPDLPRFEGAGRLDTQEIVQLEVGVRTRCALDEANSALVWTTDAGLGHVIAYHNVINALNEFNPLAPDNSGNALTHGPLTAPTVGQPRLDKEEKEWGESVQVYTFRYLMLMTTPAGPGATSGLWSY